MTPALERLEDRALAIVFDREAVSVDLVVASRVLESVWHRPGKPPWRDLKHWLPYLPATHAQLLIDAVGGWSRSRQGAALLRALRAFPTWGAYVRLTPEDEERLMAIIERDPEHKRLLEKALSQPNAFAVEAAETAIGLLRAASATQAEALAAKRVADAVPRWVGPRGLQAG